MPYIFFIFYFPDEHKRDREKSSGTDLPVIPSRGSGHLTQLFSLHPSILGQLADSALYAIASRLTSDGCGRISLIEAIQRSMNTAWRSDGRRFTWTFGRAQSGGNVEGRLGRSQLTRLQRQLVERGSDQTGRGGRIVGVGVIRRVIRRGLTIDCNLVAVGSCHRGSDRGGAHVGGGGWGFQRDATKAERRKELRSTQ